MKDTEEEEEEEEEEDEEGKYTHQKLIAKVKVNRMYKMGVIIHL